MSDRYFAGKDICEAITELFEHIGAMPAADVVEVVRCKDCKYSYDSIGGWCCSHGVCVDCIVPEDFYCAYCERKEGEQWLNT